MQIINSLLLINELINTLINLISWLIDKQFFVNLNFKIKNMHGMQYLTS